MTKQQKIRIRDELVGVAKKKMQKACSSLVNHLKDVESGATTSEFSSSSGSDAEDIGPGYDSCLYCGKRIKQKIYRHLESVHLNEVDVLDYMKYPKSSEIRRHKQQTLRLLGNDIHKPKQGDAAIPCGTRYPQVKCPECFKWMATTSLKRHMSVCSKLVLVARRAEDEEIDQPKPDMREVRRKARIAALDRIDHWASRDVLAGMKTDEVFVLITTDPYLKLYLEYQTRRYPKPRLMANIRRRTRCVAGFLKFCRDNSDLMTMDAILRVENFDEVYRLLRRFGQINEDGDMSAPSKAKSAGEHLKECAKRIQIDAMKNGNTELHQQMSAFIAYYEADFRLIAGEVRDTLRIRQHNKAKLQPTMEDIVLLNKFLDEELGKLLSLPRPLYSQL